LKLSPSPLTYKPASIGKEISKIRAKRSTDRATLATVKSQLSRVPLTPRFDAERARLQNTVSRLTNSINAGRTVETALRRCRDRQLIQSNLMTLTVLKVTNVLSGQFFVTAYASRPGPLKLSKNVFIGAGEWCLTFTGSGEIPFNYPSGTEAQITLSDPLCPATSSIVCEPSVPPDHIGWRILTAFPSNSFVENVISQFIGRIGDLQITARPYTPGLPCRGLP
jgi:hypothetical protein